MNRQNGKAQSSKGFEGASELTEIKRIKISDLKFDDRNANRGTDLGKELIHTSISKHGVGRGVLADKNLKLMAGNHAVEEMIEQGIEDVIIVPTNGRTLVVTQRVDIDKNSKAGYEMALADNRTTQANLNFDVDVIKELDAEFDLDLEDFAINVYEDGPFFPGNENETDAADQMETSYSTKNNAASSEDAQAQFEQSFFPLAIALTKAERLAFDSWKKQNKVQTDTEAFQLMFKKVKDQ